MGRMMFNMNKEYLKDRATAKWRKYVTSSTLLSSSCYGADAPSRLVSGLDRSWCCRLQVLRPEGRSVEEPAPEALGCKRPALIQQEV